MKHVNSIDVAIVGPLSNKYSDEVGQLFKDMASNESHWAYWASRGI